jgi:putative membrane protein
MPSLSWINKHARKIRIYFIGVAMGIADLVPGVSGGTVAFIAGIYEELLSGIKQVTSESLKLALKGSFRKALRTVPFAFLVPLFAGIFTSVFAFAGILAYLLEIKAPYLWSAFFGMILCSIQLVRDRVPQWTTKLVSILLVSSVATYFLVGAVPTETPDGYLALFLSGALAICAMILPGISGSFILVIIGKYEQILDAVVARDFPVLIAVAAGCIVGLALFARVLTWLFKNYHDSAVAALIGMMIGSLRKVWPWREVVTTRVNSHGEIVPLLENNILPDFTPSTLLIITLGFAGYFLVYFLEKRSGKKS